MMMFSESVAAQCRYGDNAARVFDGAEVIWECSTNDYQGSANVLLRLRDGRFAHYEWTYGSCSGCDEWEGSGYSDDEIDRIMRETAVYFDDRDTLRRYLKLTGEFEHVTVPTATSPQNGSIPGMLRYLGGGIGREFQEMGEAFAAWEKSQEGAR